MDSFELRDIVNVILEKEKLDLSGFATKAKIDRSYLSKVVNSKVRKAIGPKVQAKLRKSFPKDFLSNNENNTAAHPAAQQNTQEDNKIMVILDRLSIAFVDQAKAIADQAEGFKAQAEAFRTQAEMMKDIRKEMARADAQTIIKDTVSRIDTNLIETLAGVEFVSKMRLQQVLDAIEQVRERKEDLSQGERKKSGGTGGDGHTLGIKPLSGK